MALPDYSKDINYDSVGLQRMKDSYLKPHEKSPQDRLSYVCNFFSSDEEHAKRLYNYTSNHWLSLSTPLLNFYEKDKLSFPISCYLCYLPDKIEGIISTLSEVNNLSVCGGGVSIKIALRSQSNKSVGIVSHIKTYDSCVLAYKQGTRRGSYAMYLDIDHPEIMEFLEIRKPTGDYNMRCLNIHHAVNITDKFMNIIENCSKNKNYDDSWDLIDPKTKTVKNTISAKKLWEKILELRLQTGEPFICFIDTCNEFMNKYQKEKKFKIEQSNLCTEIIVPTNSERSSLCCLSSVNLEYYDEWKNNSDIFLYDIMEMLDNVLNFFIKKSENNLNFSRIRDSAIKEKNIGIGAMGFHAFLQKNKISIESEEAKKINKEIFRNISFYCKKNNKILGSKRGSPDDIKESGNRFAYTMAIAPTASTSIIMGNTSPSIEPYRANIYRQDTISGSFFNKNKYLEQVFIEKEFGKNLREKIWKSIIVRNGSVQHLPDGILSKKEKSFFKTFKEIDQEKLLELASDRQQFIDQGQSLSLTFDPNVHVSILHKIHLKAWKLKLKTLYYCRSEKLKNADNLTEDPFMSCESCSS